MPKMKLKINNNIKYQRIIWKNEMKSLEINEIRLRKYKKITKKKIQTIVLKD